MYCERRAKFDRKAVKMVLMKFPVRPMNWSICQIKVGSCLMRFPTERALAKFTTAYNL